jgi:two-component system LytT family response regulator
VLGLSGFEGLQQFEARPLQVIFETAYDEFAIRAFEEQACDYLLTPFTAARLRQVLERAPSRVAALRAAPRRWKLTPRLHLPGQVC